LYCVYWIHLEDHNDPYESGYIGITKNFRNRLYAHKSNKQKSHFKYAINKYGWDSLIKEILCENLSLEDALMIENNIRPDENIGWNSQRGGYLGVNSEWYHLLENSNKHKQATSIATKIAIGIKDSTEKRSLRQKIAFQKHKDSYLGKVQGDKNPRAILTNENVRIIKYELLPLGLSNEEISVKFNVKPYVIGFIRSGKNWKHI
jgi:predicted GIY-YIG superfamily endonuclease